MNAPYTHGSNVNNTVTRMVAEDLAASNLAAAKQALAVAVEKRTALTVLLSDALIYNKALADIIAPAVAELGEHFEAIRDLEPHIARCDQALGDPISVLDQLRTMGIPESLRKGLAFSSSGGEDGYCLKVKFNTLAELQQAYKDWSVMLAADARSMG